MSKVASLILLKTLPSLGEDQAGQKTAGKEGRGMILILGDKTHQHSFTADMQQK